MVRSAPEGARLEPWGRFMLRDASLRDAPQDEAAGRAASAGTSSAQLTLLAFLGFAFVMNDISHIRPMYCALDSDLFLAANELQ